MSKRWPSRKSDIFAIF